MKKKKKSKIVTINVQKIQDFKNILYETKHKFIKN